jgi:hypothetical protein
MLDRNQKTNFCTDTLANLAYDDGGDLIVY